MESVQSLPKRIDYLDSLVERFVVANPDSSSIASTADREEVSSIFLEVMIRHVLQFFWHANLAFTSCFIMTSMFDFSEEMHSLGYNVDIVCLPH